jgi:signal transduction histidine kinase
MSRDEQEPGPGADRAAILGLALDEVAEAVAVIAPDGALIHANAVWRRYAEGPDEPVAAVVERLRSVSHFEIRELPLPDGSTVFLARQDQERLLREVLDHLDSTVVVYDQADRFRYANEAYHRRYPHQAPRQIGRTFEELLRATLAAGHYAEPQAELDPEGYVKRRVAEFRDRRPGESERLLPSGHWDLMRTRFTPSGLRVSMRTDITEQKRFQEELRHANERLEVEGPARARFVAKLSQDLRTPLSAVLGYAELIEAEVMGPLGSVKYQEYAVLIRQSGRRMLDLIEGLMEASRCDARRPEMREVPVDLPALLRAELPAVKGLAGENRTQLSLILPSGLPHLRADPRMVRQMALALVSNAVRHTVGGGVSIRLRHRPDHGIDIEVSDSGTGMAPDVLARAGEPYFRGPAPPGGGEPGVGLGIAIVRDLLELHQGTFALTSTLGWGTVATLSFPPERSLAATAEAVP